MGIFDKLFKKKGKIDRIEVCFDSPPMFEAKVIENLIKHFKISDKLASDVRIHTAYGPVPGVEESLKLGKLTKRLEAFAAARAIITKMIRDPKKDLEKITISPFRVGTTSGVLIAKRV